jgi:hypothetical protein
MSSPFSSTSEKSPNEPLSRDLTPRLGRGITVLSRINYVYVKVNIL